MKEFLKKNKKAVITYGGVLAVILAVGLIWLCWDKSVGTADYTQGDNQESVSQTDSYAVSASDLSMDDLVIERVVVTRLIDIIEGTDDWGGETIVQRTQIFMVKILTGQYKGQEAAMTLDLTDITGTGKGVIVAKVGDHLRGYFEVDPNTGALSGTCTGFQRDIPLAWLAVVFIIMLTLFFGRKGIKSFAALMITCVILIFGMIPLVYYGMNPVLAVAIFGFATIIVTLLMVYGPSVSSLAAGCGAIGGVLTAAVISYVMKEIIWITGTVDEDSISLLYTDNGMRLDVSSILFAAIVIGSLGGTIDVSVSIASSLEELKEKMGNNITGWELARSGMSIGRSIMGASLNTMILAYVGSSFQLLMLFIAYNMSIADVINHELIALELLRSLAGCFGLLMTVPITSLVSAYFNSKGNMGSLDIRKLGIVDKSIKLYGRIKKIWQRSLDEAAERAKNKEDNSEPPVQNLFERAKEHYNEIENIDSDTEDNSEDDK
ncbi:MAG: YibE/F family protein [Firmicutes bacterium]|nr:YibE/F family protein [Bacillota bacterium]